MENKIFCIEIRKSGMRSTTNIKILDCFNNENNIVKIENKIYKLDEKQFESIIKHTEKNLIDLIKIAKEQTPDYLNKNTVDGYGSELLISIGGLLLKINKAAVFGKSGKLVSDFIEQIKKIIVE